MAQLMETYIYLFLYALLHASALFGFCHIGHCRDSCPLSIVAWFGKWTKPFFVHFILRKLHRIDRHLY
jgi:hypothetical protein